MKRIALVLSTVMLLTGPAHSLDIESVSGRFGVGILNSLFTAEEQSRWNLAVETQEPPPATTIANTLGASMVVTFAEGFFLTVEPALDFLWANYEWFDGRRAVPTEFENDSSNNAFILGFLIDLPLTASLRFNERIGAAFSFGPAFLFRAVFAGDPNEADNPILQTNLANIKSYFWSGRRWFYPSAALRLNIFLQEGFTFSIGTRGFMPVFNAWTADAVPFWDQAIIHVVLCMTLDI